MGTRARAKVVSRHVFEAFEVTETVYPPGLRLPPHTHRRTNITLLLRGSMLESVGWTEEGVGALDLVVKPGGTRHANVVGAQGAHTIQVRLLDAYVQALPSEHNLRDWYWLRRGPAATRMFSILQLVRTPGPGGCGLIRDGVDDLVAALAPGPVLAGTPPGWLRRIKTEVDERFPEGVRVYELAAREGVHPVYLARAFRRHYGRPITTYMKERRLRRAVALLERAREPLAVVALESGFCDQAHFCREFKICTGFTPRAFQRLMGEARLHSFNPRAEV